ncbi:GntR family transcriptional regulator [Parasalinivibrio latis]|uniref:GntR family transcriptional regulator n=1 Tax=Parasalinivibrio latis TaxID=2952610 RepID=UPI0030DF3066
MADTLRQALYAGQLKPGSRLTVASLVNQYRTGASPTREALAILCAEGLLLSEPQKGVVIPPLTRPGFEDLLECLLLSASRLLSDKPRDENQRLDILGRLHALRFLPGTINPGYQPAREQFHRELHLALVEGAGNQPLKVFFKNSLLGVERYLAFSLNSLSYKPQNYMSPDALSGFIKQILSADPETALEKYYMYWEQQADFIRLALEGQG